MKVLHGFLMVHWRRASHSICFAADLALTEGESVADALARYRDNYPHDIIVSVRDRSGRFVKRS